MFGRGATCIHQTLLQADDRGQIVRNPRVGQGIFRNPEGNNSDLGQLCLGLD